MDNTDISEALTAVKTALENRSSPTLTGGQLSALIRSTVPELDVRATVGILKGPGALTEFVRRYLSDVVERIGQLGGDPLYQINGREGASQSVPASPQIWRTFVSPNSPQHLVLNQATRNLIVRDTPAANSEGEVEVDKASSHEHDKIRAGFEASLPETMASDLRKHASADADFESWISAIKEHVPEAIRKWGHYRRRCLAELFAARVANLPVEESLQEEVLALIKASEMAVYEVPKVESTTSQKQKMKTRSADGSNMTAGADVAARRLAHAAIDHLSYDELRALRIPLGAMLDALRAET